MIAGDPSNEPNHPRLSDFQLNGNYPSIFQATLAAPPLRWSPSAIDYGQNVRSQIRRVKKSSVEIDGTQARNTLQSPCESILAC